ncbi:hypothetical protein DL96DRAFT_1685629 [Flagelloscypha sp. PMI_526]|nr:hypothetical protein DL96DRAFT_1685629 [Flagelloscypha sp. PMI_526]
MSTLANQRSYHTSRPRHERRPSLSAMLLHEIIDHDDIRRSSQSCSSSTHSDNDYKPSPSRRSSADAETASQIDRHSSVAPHTQVLQARLERVLHTATTPPPTPSHGLRRHASSRSSKRKSRSGDTFSSYPPSPELLPRRSKSSRPTNRSPTSTPPEMHDDQYFSSDSEEPSTPPKESFDPDLASLKLRHTKGYVSFGDIQGLDAGRLCYDNEEGNEATRQTWGWKQVWS